MFTAKHIERSLRSQIDSIIWGRGKQYFERGNVGGCLYKTGDAAGRESRITVFADVHGSETYSTEITVHTKSGDIESARCDCPYAGENQVYCKHIAAVGCVLADRIRSVFPLMVENLSAAAIAEALQKGHVKGMPQIPDGYDQYVKRVAALHQRTDAHTRPTNMDFHVTQSADSFPAELGHMMSTNEDGVLESIAQEEISSEPRKFIEQYEAVVRVGSGIQMQLYDTKQPSTPWQERYSLLSRSDLKSLLRDENLIMSENERLFVQCLSQRESWQESYDAHQLLLCARDANIVLYLETPDESRRMHFSQECVIPIAITLKRETAEYYSHGGASHNQSRFEYSMEPLAAWCTLATGVTGFAYVHKYEITLAAAIAELCAMTKRMRLDTHYPLVNTHYSTTITSEETTRLNNIILDLKRCFTLTTDLTPDFVITKYDTAEPTLLIDYDATASTLSIYGAVDYGCTVMEMANEWSVQGRGSYHKRFVRRKNAREHPYVVSVEGMNIGYAPIDIKKETAVYRELHDAHGFNKITVLTRSGGKPIERFLHEHWESLLRLGWKIIYTRDEIKYTTHEVSTDLKVDLDAERDWLAFDLDLYCAGERVRLADVVAFIERGDECLKTSDGRLIRVTNRADLERLVRMIERFSQNAEGKFEGRLYNAPEIADVAANSPHYRMQFAKSFDTFITEAKSGKPVNKIILPKAHRALLRPYQATGVEWMHFLRRYRFGGILADEMGLGKTIQALSHISIHSKKGVSSLVVCPKTLLHNWEREARTRFPELSVAVVEGTAAERKHIILEANDAPHLLISSYPLVQRDIEWYKMRKTPFHYLLLDEAQSIKNPRTKNAHAVKAIPAEYRLALTGTPLENGVEELWSVFDFLMPGFLGHYASFQRNFGKPIMEQGNKDVLEHLKSKTSCFMLRRTKGEVLKELPPKIEQTLRVELNDDQSVLYQEVLTRTRSELFSEVEKRGFKRSQIHILAALTKLRQICNHPSLVEPKGVYTSSKLEACLDIVRELKSERRKVLVFSQFTSMLDIIAKSLRDEKIEFAMLTGKTNNRQSLVDSFNSDPSITAFLISLKAGGTGLNLTSADAVVIFDPWWNPAVENQAIDRTHRIGQKKTVNVYRLITSGTIEEKVLLLQNKKRALFEALVEENSELFKKLTWEDVQDLFR